MGYTNMAHYLQLEKQIRSLDLFVQIWQPSTNIFQNHNFRKFPLSWALGFSLKPKMSRRSENQNQAARDLNIFFEITLMNNSHLIIIARAHLMPLNQSNSINIVISTHDLIK